MTNFTKTDIAHAKAFGIKGATDEFYSLIDRLQKCSHINHPDRLWSIDTYYGIAFQWMGKKKELEERVLKLETEINSK